MIMSLIASLEATVTMDSTITALTNFTRIQKLFNILNPETNPGSNQIKQKIMQLLQEDRAITNMLNHNFELDTEQCILTANETHWSNWLKVNTLSKLI